MISVRRLLVALAVVAPLCGCWADTKRQIAACDLEATRLYPDDKGQSSDFYYRNPDVEKYVIKCMAARGYDFDYKQSKCPLALNERATSPYCYVKY
jgi:hypothetical protein